MLHFLTYTTKGKKSRVLQDAAFTGWFDTLTELSAKDLGPQIKTHIVKSLRTSEKLGVWKPWIIATQLEKIDNGDFLLFLEDSCTINPSGHDRFLHYMEKLKECNKGILCFESPFAERQYTTYGIFRYFDSHPSSIFGKKRQINCRVLLFQKNSRSLELVYKWLDILYQAPFFFSQRLNTLWQHPGFKSNKGAQSVFSLISKVDGDCLVITDKVYRVDSKLPFHTPR